MIKLSVFMFFWVTITWSIHLGDVIAFILLLPTFLILWSWAEQLEDSEAPLLTVNTHTDVTVDDQLESSTASRDQRELDGKDADKQGDRSIRC